MSSTAEPMTIRLAGLTQDSIVDGPGLRCVVFAQGCPHRCPGCHNPKTHDLLAGTVRSIDDIWAEVSGNPLTMGLTLSGGEPFVQPLPLAELAGRAAAAGMNVWAYTGYLFEELLSGDSLALLRHVDVLVDGRFDLDRRTYGLPWRGSANQRLIDVRESLRAGRAVLHCKE